ncbi:uncharacterized protein [Atheta coriaria]|uniref:uncharacterized protein isoform X3 n=1 Tax=Dalotia coriaria TaxID=877792 RepID=UPI0031F3432C
MEEGLEFANNDLGGNLAIMVAYYELHLILRVKWGKDQHNQLSNILKSNPSHLAACICQCLSVQYNLNVYNDLWTNVKLFVLTKEIDTAQLGPVA